MTGRTRKFGLAGIVIGGSLVFGVGFAGAQAPVTREAPKEVHVVGAYTGEHGGGGGCGGGDIGTTAVTPADY